MSLVPIKHEMHSRLHLIEGAKVTGSLRVNSSEFNLSRFLHSKY